MRKTALLVAVALLAAAPAFPQQTGTIGGSAFDQQGAVLPGGRRHRRKPGADHGSYRGDRPWRRLQLHEPAPG